MTETTRPPRVAILLDPANALGRGLIAGISTIAQAHGWRIELIPPDADGLVDRLSGFRADAVAVGPGDLSAIPRGLFQRTPAVAMVVDLSESGVPSFVVDDARVGQAAAEDFLAKGLRSFAAFGAGSEQFYRGRAAGFRGVVASAGHPFSQWDGPPLHRPGTPLAGPDGVDELWQWLRALPKPVGVLAGCDEWGRALAAGCRAAGLRVPEDVAIIGADNDELLCGLAFPPLSSVVIPWDRIGQAAAVALDRMLAGEQVPPLVTAFGPAGVATRRSSDLLAVPDPHVAAALAFIRANADRRIGVQDILRHVPVYRQKLHTDFRRVVGRTVMQEVRRVHVEQAKRLLAGTDLPMPDVARRSGFPDYRKMGIAFAKEVGVTPSAYRRRSRPMAPAG